jgi:hypothetical protein
VIGKIVHVADDGEADAVAFRRELEAAQARVLTVRLSDPVGQDLVIDAFLRR